MIRSLFLIVVFFSFSFSISAQSSQISEGGGVLMLIDLEEEKAVNYERGSYVGKTHVLGDSITSLLNKVEYSYVYFKETGGAYSTKEKFIEKPIIYSSLNKVMSYYDKLLRKGQISEEKATEKLFEILNNGIALKNYRTEGFELQLKSARNKAELARLFEMVRFKN